MTALNSIITSFPNSTILSDKFITAQAAAEFTGYNIQYIRRILHAGKLGNIKVGQVWLIKLDSLNSYLEKIEGSKDHRFGPKTLPVTNHTKSKIYPTTKKKGEITFPHVIRSLTETEYKNIISRSGTTANIQDYLRINGKPIWWGRVLNDTALLPNDPVQPVTPGIITGFWRLQHWGSCMSGVD
jgi:excisionase family DNA binding protein